MSNKPRTVFGNITQVKSGGVTLASYIIPNGNTNTYSYDAFDRLSRKVLANHLYDYTYLKDSSGNTSSLISKCETSFSTIELDTTEYTYDSMGRIRTVKQGGVLKLSYEYDALGQLMRENNVYANASYKYSYDDSGNLIFKDTYAYTAPGNPLPASAASFKYYLYESSTWGDLLTNFNGTAITYDAIGNPTNWRNSPILLWNGRQLSRYNSPMYDFLDFTYNSDGIRTSKSWFDTITSYRTIHNYVLDGANIIKETVYDEETGVTYTLYYFYEPSGEIAGVIYNGNQYYFQKNIQGDVLQICDLSGNIVAKYTYDAWGTVCERRRGRIQRADCCAATVLLCRSDSAGKQKRECRKPEKYCLSQTQVV